MVFAFLVLFVFLKRKDAGEECSCFFVDVLKRGEDFSPFFGILLPILGKKHL